MQLHMSLKIVEASVLMYLTVDEIPPIDYYPLLLHGPPHRSNVHTTSILSRKLRLKLTIKTYQIFPSHLETGNIYQNAILTRAPQRKICHFLVLSSHVSKKLVPNQTRRPSRPKSAVPGALHKIYASSWS
jgi:hypothetical protein